MLCIGAGSFSFLTPVLVQASLFSSSGLIPSSSVASEGTYNSQDLPLPKPAINIDPSIATSDTAVLVADGSALLAQAGPSGTQADIAEHPTSSQISVYTVHQGDTLSSIAKLFGVSVNTIVWANDIKKGQVHEGETLVILPITGILHTVVKGETLATLAKTYNSNAHDIAQYNNLSDNQHLTIGDSVIIPDGELNASITSTPTTSSSKGSQSVKQLASGTPTAPLHGAGGPDLPNYFIWPVDGGRITQGLHGFDAVDIGAPKGTGIFAAADGTVLIARDNGAWNGGYGNYIVIQHPNGVQTLYAHASKVLVSAGDTVSQGEVIAKVGQTGDATGTHLHFEVRGAENPFGILALGQSD